MEQLLPEVWFSENKIELIGEGSYGQVYKIWDSYGNISAVKVIRIPNDPAEVQSLIREMKDPKLVKNYIFNMVENFMREIHAMESLKDNRNAVHLLSHYIEANEDDYYWTIYIQMEYLQSLQDYFNYHKPAENEIIQLGIDICNALQDCEKKSIIHRDIKPDNIMVSKDGLFKLGDFGIARNLDHSSSSLSIKGTFSYMAPEIFKGQNYDNRADLYSLGLVMYHYLNNNRSPFVNTEKKLIYFKDKEDALKQRMEGEKLPPPINASPAMAQIILKACEYNAEDRYQSAYELLWDLQNLQHGKVPKATQNNPEKPTSIRKAILCTAAAFLLIAILFFMINNRHTHDTASDQTSEEPTTAVILKTASSSKEEGWEEKYRKGKLETVVMMKDIDKYLEDIALFDEPDGQKIGKIPESSVCALIERRGSGKNKWDHIIYCGKSGWVREKYVRKVPKKSKIKYFRINPSKDQDNTVFVTETKIKLHSKPESSDETIIAERIPYGTEFMIDKVKDGWGHSYYYKNASWFECWVDLSCTESYASSWWMIERKHGENDVINLREESSEESPSLYKIPENTILKEIEHENGWAKVKYKGKKGWIKLHFATPCGKKGLITDPNYSRDE